jgi:hypothetical protein
MDLARFDSEVDVLKGLDSGECLRDVDHLENVISH